MYGGQLPTPRPPVWALRARLQVKAAIPRPPSSHALTDDVDKVSPTNQRPVLGCYILFLDYLKNCK